MEYSVAGKSLPKVDAPAKATGETVFTTDLRLPGMLHGRLLRSPLPHARILNIDVSRAMRLPGVKAVVTSADTPGLTFGYWPTMADQYPLARDKVRYIGDEVAAVAAVDEDIAEEALSLIQVDYEALPAVFDPTVGGGFGGKIEAMANEFAAVLLAKKAGRPVRLVLNREEVFSATRRRIPLVIDMKMGVKKDGTIQGLDVKVVADGGAYQSTGMLVLFHGGAYLTLPFRMPNVRYVGYRARIPISLPLALSGAMACPRCGMLSSLSWTCSQRN